MLYKLKQTNGVFDALEPMPFKNVPLEKHLENLLAKNLLVVLFEDNKLMPIFQERPQQEEADIYALDADGNLVIFELKRAVAGGDAVHQALRYCEKAARWKFEDLQRKLETYSQGNLTDLLEEHRSNFDLEHPLEKSAFNRRQHLIVVGSAANEGLIHNVDYWKSKGLWIDFLPYRVYAIKNEDKEEHYFEFFSIPYDIHSNPAQAKGVLFDTCRTHIADSIWYMCENDRVAAFGDQAYVVNYLEKNDIVFLYHKWLGIVAAGKVTSGVKTDSFKKENGEVETVSYRELNWLTSKPARTTGNPKSMPAAEIKTTLGHNFFWARTIKSPYLSFEECKKLLTALQGFISPKP